MAITINDFLDTEFLGETFLAVKSYTDVTDRETGDLTAYRLNISIQDVESPFYMEMVTVKVKNLRPSVSVESLKNNKTMPVKLKNFSMGQFNGTLWYSCDDVLPVADSKITLNK